MKRIFKQSYTFRNGSHVPAGTYVCMPTFATENDPDYTLALEKYGELRSYEAFIQSQKDDNDGNSYKKFQFAYAYDRTALNFGYGKFACPGRYFGSLIVKIFFVKLISEFDFKFLPVSKRPKNLQAHEFLFTWPWHGMLLKRRDTGPCPFRCLLYAILRV